VKRGRDDACPGFVHTQPHRDELKGNRDGPVDELEHEGGDEGDRRACDERHRQPDLHHPRDVIGRFEREERGQAARVP
jgi:hypothetical protein